MSTKYFSNMADFSKHLRDMQNSIAPEKRKTWLQRVMGETIRDLIKVSFLAGKDGNAERWMSNAAETKMGGRFAESYNTRPSGDAVTADKVRLTDTAELRGSYQILSVNADQVTVGPKGDRNVNIATRAETIWKNAIAGFGSFRERIVLIEVNKAWTHFANGIPISKIRKPSIRAM